MLDLNEFLTRKMKIDVLLKEHGWDVGDRSKVVLEVDTIQSDIKKQDYRQVNETRRNDAESKYADYLLLDSTGKPLAIIEAKRTTKDPILGQKQAEEYADDIKTQTGGRSFYFSFKRLPDMVMGQGTLRTPPPDKRVLFPPRRS